MSTRHLHAAALAIVCGWSTVGCDKASSPSEAPVQGSASRQVASASPAAVGADVIRFSSDGPVAYLQAGAVLGNVYREGHVSLSPAGEDEAYLYYAVFECDLTTFECGYIEEAYGFLSGDEVTRSHDRITIRANSAGNPSFELANGSGGPIEVTWTELSGWSYRASTQSRQRSPAYSTQSHGTYTLSSALVEGIFIGIPIEPGNAYAEMGAVKDGGVTITRAQ